ncbi:MAG: cytochrome c [Saprospiraceae bacterium]|uniref:Cytochrome c n=1 Tax=Candidatus Opimibacter skivensis TaxID=2982028 RepID=A0A9D7XSA7_9BACT|nr:cytochrome c [Candidatus Opimibacter skivensis]
MKTLLLCLCGLFITAAVIMAFRHSPQQNAPWPVPDKYKTMKNPVKFDKTAATALYNTHCKSCHGKEGLGDGTKAAQLKTKCGDFSSADFQKQSDGAIFYKTLEGRDDMPSFKKKLPDQEDIWQLVHYMRTLAE